MFIGSPNATVDGDALLIEGSACQHPGSEPKRRRPISGKNEITVSHIMAVGMIGFTAVAAVIMFTASPHVSSHLVDCFRNLFH